MTSRQLWDRYQKFLCDCPSVGLRVDISRMNFPDDFFERMAGPMDRAFGAMELLEKGGIANPDEKRMVGHYWLRAPQLAPSAEIRDAIVGNLKAIHAFARQVHTGKAKPQRAARFKNLLVIGIGGSALGPQFVGDALRGPKDKMKPFFFDNTDPDGIDRTLLDIGGGLKETLTIVISKSGGTKETRNGMLEAAKAYGAQKLDFGKHAVAVTGADSALDQHAVTEKWRIRFPMWDWVGGRTSELAGVGLLPAALQGIDIDKMLAGAAATDEVTRTRDVLKNPAALLALMWHHAGGGRGAKDMVVLPYKDRLILFSRYLQQLVMESLGKEKGLDGQLVNQGIAVYGNKGSTDQHAYVQQLRDGVNNFFVTFIQVLKDRSTRSMKFEEGVTAGDYLLGFLVGTRGALHEKDRESLTVTVSDVGPRSVGALIALYERAVGFYGSLVNVNAYHQPGVEAGKKAAAGVLDLQGRLLAAMRRTKGKGHTVEELVSELGTTDDAEAAFIILEHLAVNPDHGVQREVGKTIYESRYRVS